MTLTIYDQLEQGSTEWLERGAWWRVFIGHTDYALGDFYTTNVTAHDAAVRYANKRNSLA